MQVTERLTLRQFTAADAGDLLALDGDPRVMRFLDPETKSLAQIQADVLPRFMADYDRFPGFGFWAAHARAEDGFIGWFGLRPVTRTAVAMVDWPDAPPGDTTVASLGTGCAPAPGAVATRPKEPGHWCGGPSPT